MKLLFNTWVKKFGGSSLLSEHLNVSEPAVRVWLRGQGSPHAETIYKIIKLSKETLTFEQIFKESTRGKK